jgi:RNA polymerase sigma-70 factor (ECF subfamily)
MPDSKDTMLMRSLKEGKKSAYEKAYRKYHQPLLQFARKYVKSGSLAEDAVQDIFLTLWQERKRLDELRSLKGFLYTSLKNHILNLIRDSHQEIYEAYEPDAAPAADRNEVEEKLIYEDYKNLANKAIDQLPFRRRQIFEMKRVSDLTNKQIAQKLGVSVHTVKSEYYRGSQIVKGYLKQHIKSLENMEW